MEEGSFEVTKLTIPQKIIRGFGWASILGGITNIVDSIPSRNFMQAAEGITSIIIGGGLASGLGDELGKAVTPTHSRSEVQHIEE